MTIKSPLITLSNGTTRLNRAFGAQWAELLTRVTGRDDAFVPGLRELDYVEGETHDAGRPTHPR
jgi:hypothetical protein